MDLYILTEELERLDIIDDFTSIIWNRRYHTSGSFELHLPITIRNIQLLKKDRIIYRDLDIDTNEDNELLVEACFVETIQLGYNEDTQEEELIVKGNSITKYTDRRINWGIVNFNGKVEKLMRMLVNDNLISPSDLNRKITNLELGELNNYDESVNYQNSYGNVHDELEAISKTSKIGYDVVLDVENKKMIFRTYKGVNRADSQELIAPCIFSRDFENILEQYYLESYSQFKNTALIAGAGEGKDRKITSIEKGIGIERYEMYVDARDIQNIKTENEAEIVIPDEEYIPLLIQRGNEKLEECNKVETFNSVINTNGNNVYKVDYDLGDIVTVTDDEWGIAIDTRITEIEEIYENGVLIINVVFGDDLPTILDKIKKVI